MVKGKWSNFKNKQKKEQKHSSSISLSCKNKIHRMRTENKIKSEEWDYLTSRRRERKNFNIYIYIFKSKELKFLGKPALPIFLAFLQLKLRSLLKHRNLTISVIEYRSVQFLLFLGYLMYVLLSFTNSCCK